MAKSARSLTTAVGLMLTAVTMLAETPVAAQAARAPGSGSSASQRVISDPMADISAPALSYNGRYVAYASIRRDRVSPPQELRRADFSTGRSELLNPSVDGGVARGNYGRPPVISANGSRTAFSSTAERLVPGDVNGRNDAFVRDASTDTTLLASVALDGGVANGATGMTSLSKSGRYAVFTSSATDVVAGSTTTNSDVYRRDLTTHTTLQVTVRPDGSPSRGPGSTAADVSANGNLVAFNSYDTDLVRNDDADQDSDLFIRNLTTGVTRWLSNGVPAGANPDGVVLSPDGRWVSSRWADGSLHLTRTDTGLTSTVTANGYALLGAFSSDLGRFVFISDGTPYVRDLSTGVDTAVVFPAGGFVTTVGISGDGRFAAYDWVPDTGGPTRIYRVAL